MIEDTPAAPSDTLLRPELIIVHMVQASQPSIPHSSGPSVSRQETGRDGIEWKRRHNVSRDEPTLGATV